MERFLENAMYASRWLLAPVYFGLSLGLIALTIKFFQEIFHILPHIFSVSESELILTLLSLVDMTLVGGLLVMVMFSGYENFVSKLDVEDGGDRPDWMGTVDFSGLKMKLIASIVAISGIHLLKVFMSLGKGDPAHAASAETMQWMVIIHLTFVVSGVLLALMDWLSAKTDKH